MKITTLPVYSKLADEAEIPSEIASKLPQNADGSRWRLSEHQVETYRALTSRQYDVVFNTAMTGDGKSLAAYLPALVKNDPVLTMYPTNELVRDQELQMAGMKEQWKAKFLFSGLNASKLEKMVVAEQGTNKAAALTQIANNHRVVLTNPDIFHYLAQFFYTRRDDAPDLLFARRIVENFEQFVFDEFHTFETPQVVSVVNALLLVREYMKNQQERKRFLFLSATPGEVLRDYLQRAKFDAYMVETNGRYQHHSSDPNQWRLIIHQTDIHFFSQTLEDWLAAHAEDTLLPFFHANRPAAKGAIIVNSVAAAYRIKTRLQPIFEKSGLTVQLNTGLSSDELKKASRDSDLLIGTSTVDVGVDFRINLLLFESRDAGTFLQRLGRLGRHTDDGRGNTFGTFQAFAFVPPFIAERLSARLQTEGEYTRTDLTQAVREVYPSATHFKAYAQLWGRYQCAHVLRSLNRPTVRDSYTQTRQNLISHYWQTFQINGIKATQEYKDWPSEKRALLDEAHSFRGGSPLQCGLVDHTEKIENQVKQYSLMSLVGQANLAWLEQEEFETKARALNQGLLPVAMKELAGWFNFYGFAQERRRVVVKVNHPITEWGTEEWGVAKVLNKISLDIDGVEWINALNRHLQQRKLVVALCQTAPDELRYKLFLPPLFQLYEFESPQAPGLKGTIAFARQALLLETALRSSNFVCGGNGAFFA